MRAAGPDDRAWMQRALELARAGWGQVHPNPMVGAVVVADGELVGEGYHASFGGPHAEVAALEQAGPRARGSTLYVTLEPCKHVGKTAACCPAIADAGVARVVYASSDPNPVAGGGAAELRQRGVVVEGGVLAAEAARLNAPFLWWHEHRTPWLALKLAVSLDGKIAEREGVRSDLTGAAARDEVMRLRSAHDAILVGAGTARIDDPLLTVRGRWRARVAPLRVVLDTDAGLSLASRLVTTAAESPVLVLAGHQADSNRIESLRSSGVEVAQIESEPGVGLRLDAAMREIARRGRTSILCEGGAALATSLLRERLVRRLHWFVAPRMLGPQGVGAVETPVELEGQWSLDAQRSFGEDVLIEWSHAAAGLEPGKE